MLPAKSIKSGIPDLSQKNTAPHHAFVGFVGGSLDLEHAVEIPTHDDTENLSDTGSYQEEDQYEDTGSIRSVKQGGLRSDPKEYNPISPILSPLWKEPPL